MSFNFFHIRTDDFSTFGGGGHDVVITRDNYEAYFVMYVDDELNATERMAVEDFLQQNPDLEEEMVMLQQSVLRADEKIVFEQKELLFKQSDAITPINEHNCEEYFVLYGDDELTNEEKDTVEQFVYHHPQFQADFELIQQVKLVPDNSLTFPDKTYLFRSEEDDNRVIAFPWWRFAAAAVALLLIGGAAWYFTVQIGNTEMAGVDTKPAQAGQQQKQPASNTGNNSTKETGKNNVAAIAPPVHTNQNSNQTSKLASQQHNDQKNISKPGNIQQASYVKHTDGQRIVNDAADPIDISFSPKPVEVVPGNSERPVVKNAVIKTTIPSPIAVNTTKAQREEETDQSQDGYVLNTSINKTPLRGFFRRVSRVVDKVTDHDDNSNGGVRIANLSIALK